VTQTPDSIVPITTDARSAAEKFSAQHDTELLTILFTDLVDSTKLQSELGNLEAARLTELHRKIVRDELAKYDAREIEWAGDSCLAVFTKPSDAVVFALRMQAEHRRMREEESKLPLVRVGMHLGEIVVRMGDKKEDLFGLQVSESARVMSVARGNQIFCTRAVFDNARGSLRGSAIEGVGDVVWVNYGAYLLKGSEDSVELCEFGSNDVAVLKAPQPSDRVSPLLPERAMTYHPLVPSNGVPHPPIRIPRWTFAAGVVVLVVLGGFAGRIIPGSSRPASAVSAPVPQPEPVRRYSINLSPDAPLQPLNMEGSGSGMALSPDGLLLVYVASTGPATKQLFLRRLDQVGDARPIAETEGAFEPFFSPDSQWIGFFTPDKLKKVSVLGGASITLCEVSNPRHASWGGDGHIVFSSQLQQGLKRTSAAGGPVEDLMDERFMESNGFLLLAYPTVLPGGRNVLFTCAASLHIEDLQIAALALETGEVKFLLKEAFCYAYMSTGHLIYGQDGAVMAAPFDAGKLKFTGSAVPVTEADMELHRQVNIPTQFTFSAEGLLVYAPSSEDPGGPSVARALVWVDREGNEELLEAPPRPYRSVALSPDGTHVTVLLSDKLDFWILDLTRKPVTQQRLTFDLQVWNEPVWMPDSRRVVFRILRDGMFSLSWKAANGTGPVESLYASENDIRASAFSPDGKFLLLERHLSGMNDDIWALSLDGEPAARPLMAESYDESDPAISPDGRWIAYTSDESGEYEVYVRPFPNVDDGKWLISTQTGGYPVWAPDGRELYYVHGQSPEQMMTVTVETEPTFAVGNPKVLFEAPYYVIAGRPYDISPDGKRFLMIKDETQAQEGDEVVESTPRTELIVVENWDEVLKGITPAEGKP
jgi:class 3 adenylate cyclase/Tol biopolymer transport system component